MNTLLYTPLLDNRYGEGKITSRIGLQADAVTFRTTDNLYAMTQDALTKDPNIKCVLVDEAHFLNKNQVIALGDVCDQLNVPVLAYGIRSDYQGEPFEGSLYLLTLADLLIEIKTICHCGRKATMVYRTNDAGERVFEGKQVLIGGNERYISVCRKHFREDLMAREGLS